MNLQHMACQLYTLRNHLQTPTDIAASLKKVKEIGFDAVQLAGLGPIETGELAKMLQGEGLLPCGSHEPGEMLFGDIERVIDRLKALNCPCASYPWPGGIRFDTTENVKSFAAKLNAAGRALTGAGLTFCYHNHQMEFHRLSGRLVLDIIYGETDPNCVKAELDTYWVQFGGCNPADWCHRLKGRLVNLHMKDYAVDADGQVRFAEVGSGNLDWPEIIADAEESGCEWFIIEQDECRGDPFESVRKSLNYVRLHLITD
jgi:sugar phosphate isomerase/epimerase